jgi:nitrate reductase gamma subunit
MDYLIYAQAVSLIAMFFCFIMCFLHFLRIIKLGAPKDFSEPAGSVSAGVLYSNTGAMLPKQKESAYLHLPTYAAGVFFHIGSLVALLTFLFLIPAIVWAFFFYHPFLSALIALCLYASSGCGIGLFFKRLTSNKLRPFSNMDDYLSVLLVTLFHLASAILFTAFAFHEYFHHYFSSQIHSGIMYAYFIVVTLFFLYLPFSKMKHVIYYFAARYHLGFFYGRRGTWPPKKDRKSVRNF